MVIYKITNLVNNKVYIGKTCRNLSCRKSEHLYNMSRNTRNNHLYNALKKYGVKNFLWESLQDNICTEENLNYLERMYLQEHLEAGYILYNKKDGGEGGKHSEETKIKISMAHKKLNKSGFKHKAETIFKMKKVKRTEFHKEIISKSNKTRIVIKPFEILDKTTLKTIGVWSSKIQCSRDLHISLSAIDAGLKNKVKKHRKYIYKYIGGNNGTS